MSITRHPAIEAYFASETNDDGDALKNVFTHDATVRDEGSTIVGLDAIASWRTAAKAKYDYTAEPLEAQENQTQSVVRVRLAGNFPGSPAVVTYTFELREGKVSALKIG